MRFTGYAALFDRVDRGGDIVRRGAFADAAGVPLLWQHRGRPVGRVEVSEDARGLRVAGEIDVPEVAALVRQGALCGLSIGYRALDARQGAWREILRAALVEVSLVAQPMQPGARIAAVGD